MAITDEIFDFPNFPIEKQLFYTPGTSSAGGFTTGGARIMTYEPGGFAHLDIQPAMQVNEWDYPETSWLMSQGSGKILRVRLAPTPQIAGGRSTNDGVPWDNNSPWSNGQNWMGDLALTFGAVSLKGTSKVTVDTAAYGAIFSRGHLIGHKHSAYMINKVTALGGSKYQLDVSPPVRANIAVGDNAFNRPYFTGQIANQNDILATYDADMAGLIQMPKITLMEVIINE